MRTIELDPDSELACIAQRLPCVSSAFRRPAREGRAQLHHLGPDSTGLPGNHVIKGVWPAFYLKVPSQPLIVY